MKSKKQLPVKWYSGHWHNHKVVDYEGVKFECMNCINENYEYLRNDGRFAWYKENKEDNENEQI